MECDLYTDQVGRSNFRRPKISRVEGFTKIFKLSQSKRRRTANVRKVVVL